MASTCVLLHGAGSCPETVRDLLGPACPPGCTLVVPRLGGGAQDTAELLRGLVAGVHASGERVVLVAGVSLGAHAAALWASSDQVDVPLVLAMPAWTGVPDDVAALTAAGADELERDGRDTVLDRLHTTYGPDWILDELDRGWRSQDESALVAALRAAGASPAPTSAELALVPGPCAVVALEDDPLHPVPVARAWAAAVPRSALALVARSAPGTDRGVLGRTARALLTGPLSGSR